MISSQHQFFGDHVRSIYPDAIEACWIPGIELQFYPDRHAYDTEDGLYENVYSCHRNSAGHLVIDVDY